MFPFCSQDCSSLSTVSIWFEVHCKRECLYLTLTIAPCLLCSGHTNPTSPYWHRVASGFLSWVLSNPKLSDVFQEHSVVLNILLHKTNFEERREGNHGDGFLPRPSLRRGVVHGICK